jgi:hypothetical protein
VLTCRFSYCRLELGCKSQQASVQDADVVEALGQESVMQGAEHTQQQQTPGLRRNTHFFKADVGDLQGHTSVP